MERWLPLLDYPLYEASNQGRIRNVDSGHVLAVSRQGDNRACVALMFGRTQVRRTLALLICKTFLPPPPRADFTTPIHFDGDLMNCSVQNLAWRPRWFALQYTMQFGKNLGQTGAVRDIGTRIIYDDVWDVVLNFGVLYNDVVKSIVNKTYVFPVMNCFEWVDPD